MATSPARPFVIFERQGGLTNDTTDNGGDVR